MAIEYFTPAAYGQMAVSSISSNVVIPGTSNPALYLNNGGPYAVAVLLSTSSSQVVTPSTGIVIPAGASLFLGVGSNTRISAIALGGGPSNCLLNMAAGT
jgi:hypothetical protein